MVVYETTYRKNGCQMSETMEYLLYAPFDSIVEDTRKQIKLNLKDGHENRSPKGEYTVIECQGYEPVTIEWDELRRENLGAIK